MEETIVIRGLSRQAKSYGLPLPYMMAVGALTVLPFMIIKWISLLALFPVWYFAARAITAINPHGHRILLARLRFVPESFRNKNLTFKRSRRGSV